MSELKKCPLCGAELKVYGPEDWKPTFYDPDSGGDPYTAVCDCGFNFHTNHYDYAEFVKAVNRRAQPENKPLTLDELLQLDGEPVYYDWDDIGWSKVVVINEYPRIAAVINHGRGYECALYTPTDIMGNSYAYRFKPERSEG